MLLILFILPAVTANLYTEISKYVYNIHSKGVTFTNVNVCTYSKNNFDNSDECVCGKYRDSKNIFFGEYGYICMPNNLKYDDKASEEYISELRKEYSQKTLREILEFFGSYYLKFAWDNFISRRDTFQYWTTMMQPQHILLGATLRPKSLKRTIFQNYTLNDKLCTMGLYAKFDNVPTTVGVTLRFKLKYMMFDPNADESTNKSVNCADLSQMFTLEKFRRDIQHSNNLDALYKFHASYQIQEKTVQKDSDTGKIIMEYAKVCCFPKEYAWLNLQLANTKIHFIYPWQHITDIYTVSASKECPVETTV
ncbi:hypothetical protein MRV_0115 [Murid herpesvirus 3]|uniref:Uncharacterized protein n=2 Tax=Murid betaherpesvirus 3 TaxID=2560603 RepID=A0A1P8VIZ9_9BETA|nr:hypothetical protein MRV_0115 [Murine roseolovirus]APZ76326.1 hypothetical protein MRV_0115 [Murid betaherpesvirus 3]AYH64764.1 hypothetical protein MRV_0115 [Murid herpesvirus 3]